MKLNNLALDFLMRRCEKMLRVEDLAASAEVSHNQIRRLERDGKTKLSKKDTKFLYDALESLEGKCADGGCPFLLSAVSQYDYRLAEIRHLYKSIGKCSGPVREYNLRIFTQKIDDTGKMLKENSSIAGYEAEKRRDILDANGELSPYESDSCMEYDALWDLSDHFKRERSNMLKGLEPEYLERNVPLQKMLSRKYYW